jgi:hypothetical protein
MTVHSFTSVVARPLLVVLLIFSFGVIKVVAAELKLEAKLIWATDDEKSPDPKHKPVDDAVAKQLQKLFKWKNYFEVTKQVKVVPPRGSNRFELSKQCTVEIRELEGPKVEVKLVGEGEAVYKATKTLRKGESFAYAGDDKNNCGWFVIISALDEK